MKAVTGERVRSVKLNHREMIGGGVEFSILYIKVKKRQGQGKKKRSTSLGFRRDRRM